MSFHLPDHFVNAVDHFVQQTIQMAQSENGKVCFIVNALTY